MPSRQPKPILKKGGNKSHSSNSNHGSKSGKPGKPGPSSASSSVARNTKLNAGSKFQKTMQVKQQKAKLAEVKQPEQLVEDESGDEAFGAEDEDEEMGSGEGSEIDTDEEIARGPEGTKKKSMSEYHSSRMVFWLLRSRWKRGNPLPFKVMDGVLGREGTVYRQITPAFPMTLQCSMPPGGEAFKLALQFEV